MNGVQRHRKQIMFGELPEHADYKLGATYAVNGWNIGAYWSDSNTNGSVYTIAGKNIGKSTGTVFVQKTL